MSNFPIQSALPAPNEFSMMKEMAQMAVKSGLLPQEINTPEKAMIIMLKGRELQIPPMQAFSHIHVIKGKPAMSSELMLSQIYKCVPKSAVNFLITNETECTIEAQRPNGAKTKFSFTLDKAKKANLLGNPSWQKYPSAMLRARCISAMARALFPDALNGISYTPEELGADIDISEDGAEVVKEVSVKATAPQEPAVNHASTEHVEQPKEPMKNEAPISMTDAEALYYKAKMKRNWNKSDIDAMIIKYYQTDSALKLKKWQFDHIMNHLDLNNADRGQ